MTTPYLPARYVIAGIILLTVLFITILSTDNELPTTASISNPDNVIADEHIIESAKTNDIILDTSVVDKNPLTNTPLPPPEQDELTSLLPTQSPPIPVNIQADTIGQQDFEIPTAQDEFLLAQLDVLFTDTNYTSTTNIKQIMTSNEYRQLTRTGRKVFLAELSRKMNSGELDTEQMFNKKFDQEYMDSLKNKRRFQEAPGTRPTLTHY